MLKRHRLSRRADFARLRRHGRRFAHPLCVLVACPQTYLLPYPRFAFSASKRIGNAVQRNRAKRLMREAVRFYLPRLRPHWDYLFIARAKTPQAMFADVREALRSLLRQAQLLNGEVDET